MGSFVDIPLDLIPISHFYAFNCPSAVNYLSILKI